MEVDYAAVQARREKVVSTLTGGVGGLFKKNGIDLIEGDASLGPRGAGATAQAPTPGADRRSVTALATVS